jgi:CRISPR-associated exonuclease Cas4
MTAAGWMATGAVMALVLGLVLVVARGALRRRRGLGGGRTVALDNVALTSHRYGLTGRPDRIIREGEAVIPEEWKSAPQLREWHRAQMGVYFLLIEDQLKVRPSHSFIVLGDGTRHRIENDALLRSWVLGLAGSIRGTETGTLDGNRDAISCAPLVVFQIRRDGNRERVYKLIASGFHSLLSWSGHAVPFLFRNEIFQGESCDCPG